MAFVRVGRFEAQPQSRDRLRVIYETEAIPVIRAAPGNISAALLQDQVAADSFLAITVWHSQADAEAHERSGQARAMVDKIRFAFAGPPTLRTYQAFGIPH